MIRVLAEAEDILQEVFLSIYIERQRHDAGGQRKDMDSAIWFLQSALAPVVS